MHVYQAIRGKRGMVAQRVVTSSPKSLERGKAESCAGFAKAALLAAEAAHEAARPQAPVADLDADDIVEAAMCGRYKIGATAEVVDGAA